MKTLALKLGTLALTLYSLAGCEQPAIGGFVGGGSGTPTSSPTPRTYWPEDVKYLDTAIAMHKAALPLVARAAKASINPKVKQLTKKQMERMQRQIRLFSMWRQRWYPRVEPFTDYDEASAAERMEISDRPLKDRAWLDEMESYQRGTLHLNQHYQNRVQRPELRSYTGNAINRMDDEVDETRAVIEKL